MSDIPLVNQILEFVPLKTASGEGPWGVDHTRRVLTKPEYSYLDPRPKLRYLTTGGGGMLVRHDWEEFKRRLADEGLKQPPKKTKLMEARHQARLSRERKRQKLRGIRKTVEG